MLTLFSAIALLFAPHAARAGCDVITSDKNLIFSSVTDPMQARFKIFYSENGGKTAFGEPASCEPGDYRCEVGKKNSKQVELPLCSHLNVQEASGILKSAALVNQCE